MKRKIALYLTAVLIISAVVAAAGMYLSANSVPENRVDRIGGRNRFGTAVAISQEGWETSDYVVLARGDEFADALAGVPLAYSLDAPILLTHSNRLPDSTRQQIIDLKAKTVIILGGEGAISQAVEDDVIKMGLTIDRINGANRYDTSGLIAKRMKAAGTYNGKVIVANGMNFPDALAASAYAARLGYPIILCPDNRIPATSQSAIDELNPEAAYVIGGTAVINDEVMDKLPSPKRIYGKNRYGTATALAEEFKPGNVRYFVATGFDFADAVAGGVLAAKNDAGLLLVSRTVPSSVVEYIANYPVRLATIFGGPGAVSEDIEIELEKLLDSAALAQAIVDAQAAIDALPEQVAASEDSTDAQGYVDAAQELIDAVLALDPDYDTSAWDAVIAEQQAIVDAMKAVEAAENSAGALAKDGTDTQEAIDAAQGLYDTAAAQVNALPDGEIKTALAARLAQAQADIDAAQEALNAVNEATTAVVDAENAANALVGDGSDTQAAIDAAQGLYGTAAAQVNALPDGDIKTALAARLAQAQADIDAAQEALNAVNEATTAVVDAENAANALVGDGTDTQEAIDATQNLYDAAAAQVNALPDGAIKTGLEKRLALVQAGIDTAQAALDAVNAATAAVVAAEDSSGALAKDGTDTQEAIDAAQSRYDAAADQVNALPDSTVKIELEERLALVKADIDAAQAALNAVNAATAAVEAAENAASALANDGTDSQADITAAQGLYDAAAALVNALPDGTIKTGLEERLALVQADIDAAQAALDAVIAATAALEAAEDSAGALTKDGADTQDDINAAQILYNEAQALVAELPDGEIKTALAARLEQVQTDIDAAQAALNAVNAATAAVVAAEDSSGALAKDGTDTQEAIDAAQSRYDAAADQVNALPDSTVKIELEERLALVKADIDAAQAALNAVNEATTAVVDAENAANALVGDGSDTQEAIDAAQGLYDTAAAQVNALPDGEIKTALAARLAQAQADIDAAQEALNAVNEATTAVVDAENAANALVGDGTDTQEAIDAAQGLYDTAAAQVNALPDGEIKTALAARLAQAQADIDAAQEALNAVNEATTAVVDAENAANALVGDGSDTQAAIDAAQGLYGTAAAQVNALPDGDIKTALTARLAQAQADIDAAQEALSAVNEATTAVAATENAASALAGDGSDTQAAIDAAQGLYGTAAAQVNALPDGDIKSGLEERLAPVQADIDAAQAALDAVNAATAAVEAAENAASALAKDGTDFQAAIDAAQVLHIDAQALVAELPAGAIKTGFEVRLAQVQADIDAAQKALDFLKGIQEVEAMIAALPSVDELVLSDYIEVQAARAAFEALSEEQQDLVSNLATLAAAEDRISEQVLVDIDNRINAVIPQLNLEGTGIAGITYADKHAVFTIDDLNIDIINFADSGVLDLFLEMFKDVKTAEINGQVINLEGMSKAELKTAVGQYLIYPLIEGGETRNLIELVGKSASADVTIQLGSASYKASYSVDFVAATFNLTTAAENGNAEGAGVYAVGSEVTITATAATDYAFFNWADEAGNEVSTANPYIFTMVNRDLTLTANFVKTEAAVLADVDSRIVDAIANLNLAGTGIIEVAYENRLATFLIDDAQESISAFAGSGVFELYLDKFTDVINADIYIGAEQVGAIDHPGSMTVEGLRSAVLDNLIIPLVGEDAAMILKDLAGKSASAEITFSAGFVQYTAVYTIRFQLTDKALADEVTALINALLPLEGLVLAEKGAVECARAAYADLTPVQQGLVSNLDILSAAEARITKLEVLEEAKVAAAGKLEAEYTILSWNGLSAALALPETTISDIEAKTTAIWDAIANLVRKADLTAYNAALAAVNEADYTAESWQAYQEVVLANTVTPENTQDEADAATAAIIAAQADLVREFPSGLTSNSDIFDFVNDLVYPWRHDYSITDRVAYYPTNQGVGSSKSAFTCKALGPGVLTYEYKVSAEDNWDYLKIYVDGRLVKEHKASTDWTSDLIKLSKTAQTVKFEYKKDSSNDRKDDKVWIANLDLFTGDKNLVIAVDGAMHGSVNASADGASLSLGMNVIPAGAEIAFSATANTGAAFYGWVDESGNLLSTSSDYGFTLLTDRTVIAVFAPAGTYVVRRDGMFYSEADGGLAAALNDAVSGNTIFLLENTALSESAAVPEGATLMVPYKPAETSPTELGTTSTATGRVSWTNEAKYLYLTLTIPEGMTLDIDGNVTLGAVCSYPAQNYQGHTSGAYSQIICDGTINVNGQGVLDLYGLLKGNGRVTANSGAKIYQPFMIADFAGGTNTQALFNLNQTPFKRYAMVNIQTDLVMHYGATMYGHASLYFWESITTLDAEFIGPNGLIILSEGATLTATYDSANYVNQALTGNNLNSDIGKTTIVISGGAKSGFMTYPYGIVTSGVYFSIPYNYDIVLENGEYNFAYAYKLMPGASLWVKDTATLEVTSGFYVYDGLLQSDMSGKSYPTTAMLQEHGFSPSANFIVDGTFIVRSGKIFGGIIQTNGGGEIILEENANVVNEAVTDGGKTKYDANSSVFALPGRIYDANAGVLIAVEAGNSYAGQATAENWLLADFTATYAVNSTVEDYSEDISNPSFPHYHKWMTSTLTINQPMAGAWYKQ
ncbi:MAG: cell wall-binding repeat-containing protein [Bacillota bacterium]